MITDARRLAAGFALDADVCIVGAGAAGISIAAALNGSKISVCLLESGGFRTELQTQALYRGTYAGNVPTLGDGYMSGSRMRMFGGTTNLWGGWCRPLESIDFEERPWVPGSGWPISKADLDPYYLRAAQFMGMPSFEKDLDADDPRLPPTLDDDRFEGRLYQFNAKRFGDDHRKELTDSTNVRLVHHANAVEIRSTEAGTAVEELRVATLSGVSGTVRARAFVLAAGGIENCRLLLASDGRQQGGVGNSHDQVGRYFMEHPVAKVGMGPMFVWPGVSVELYKSHGRRFPRASFLFPRDDVLRQHQLLSIALVMTPTIGPEATWDPFDLAMMRASFDVHTLDRSDTGFQELERVRTVYMCEQEPNSESRVTLTDDRDALGMQRVRLAWNLTGAEIDSIYRFADLFGRKIAGERFGRVKHATPPEDLIHVMGIGHHHMGGTRMHRDPKQGVVDADCRIHGVENLYVAGSSVFPTSGSANPTFTIVALALRIEQHLRQRLGAA